MFVTEWVRNLELQRDLHNSWTFINGKWQWTLLLSQNLVTANWYRCSVVGN